VRAEIFDALRGVLFALPIALRVACDTARECAHTRARRRYETRHLQFELQSSTFRASALAAT